MRDAGSRLITFDYASEPGIDDAGPFAIALRHVLARRERPRDRPYDSPAGVVPGGRRRAAASPRAAEEAPDRSSDCVVPETRVE